ncbi:MAG: hypothetical protein QW041_03235 [Candidatus Pacearchaeota archaeon]
MVKYKMINDKKGIIRIVEAAIAVLILLGFMIFIISKQIQVPTTEENIYKIGHQVLREISDNYTLRDDVLKDDLNRINKTIEERISPFPLKFSITSCAPEESCLCSGCPSDKEIYADDIIISTNLSDYKPKKLALFMWIT